MTALARLDAPPALARHGVVALINHDGARAQPVPVSLDPLDPAAGALLGDPRPLDGGQLNGWLAPGEIRSVLVNHIGSVREGQPASVGGMTTATRWGLLGSGRLAGAARLGLASIGIGGVVGTGIYAASRWSRTPTAEASGATVGVSTAAHEAQRAPTAARTDEHAVQHIESLPSEDAADAHPDGAGALA